MKMKMVFRLPTLALCLAFLLFGLSCSVGDGTPPAQIEDLSFDPLNRILSWTAPGDDGNSGKATIYFVRYLEDTQVAEILGVPSLDGVPFSDIEQAVQNNFDIATQIPDFQSPDVAGSPQSFLPPRLDISGTINYYYAIRTNDEVGNSSRPSNVVEVNTILSPVQYLSTEQGTCLGASVTGGNFDAGLDDDNIPFNDIAIGDPCVGRVYIFFGRQDITEGSMGSIDVSEADVTIIGNASDQFGASVAGIVDFDGNRDAQELVIGAPGFDSGRGKVYVVFGSSALPSVIDLINGSESRIEITGENPGDNFGFSVGDGDGITDGRGVFLAGAPNALANTGKAYVFKGRNLNIDGPNSAGDAQAVYTGQAQGNLFGFDVAGVGEVDNNNRDDLGVGAPGANKAYVIFGKSNVQSQDLSVDLTDVVILEQSGAAGFGTSLSGGDVDDDGEGLSDVVVGAPGANNDTGSVFLYSGQAIDDANQNGTMPASSTVFQGTNEGDLFGQSVQVYDFVTPVVETRDRSTATVLDLQITNADVGVGAPGTETGTFYLFFGRDNLPATVAASNAEVIINANMGQTGLGLNVSFIGDVDGDLIEDIGLGGDGFGQIEF